jgi:hypothetical protein
VGIAIPSLPAACKTVTPGSTSTGLLSIVNRIVFVSPFITKNDLIIFHPPLADSLILPFEF